MGKAALIKSRTTAVVSTVLLFLILSVAAVSAGTFEYSQAPLIKVFCREDMCCIDRYDNSKYIQYGGFLYDYMQEVAQSNNWLYEFSTEDPKGIGLRQILESGAADIVSCISLPQAEANKLVVSKHAFIDADAALYVNRERKQFLAAAADFAGKKIGIVDGYSRNADIIEYFAGKEKKPKFISFANKGQAYDALRADVVSGIFLVGNRTESWCFPAVKFSEEKLYFAALPAKANLIRKIDSAIITIESVNPDFMRKIKNKHYLDSVKERLNFTDSELQYIKNNKVVMSGHIFEGYPFEFRGDTYWAKGISTEILRLLGNYTGLYFATQKTYNYTDAVENIKSGKIDILPYVKRNFFHGKKNNYHMTQPYLKTPVVMVTKDGFKGDPTNIAFPISFSLTERITADFPGSGVIYFNTAEECFNALRREDADMLFTDSRTAEHLLGYGKFNGLKAQTYGNIYEEAAVAVSDKTDPRLLSVINKGLGKISESELNTAIAKYTLAKRKQNIRDFIDIYPLETGMAAALVSTAAALLLGYLFLIKNREKKRMERLCYDDELTGEKNFNYFIEKAPEKIKANSSKRYAAVRINIVEFKFINDTLGYEDGNTILCGISDMLKKFIDPETELFARIHADKFALLLTFDSNSDLGAKIEKLCSEFDSFNTRGLVRYPLIFNGGIYVIKNVDMPVKQMFDYAAFAEKNLAKHRYCNSFAYYDGRVMSDIREEKKIESTMREALKNGYLVPYLQPKVNCRTLETVGAEALVRWIDPVKGIVPPDRFIPYFEKSGFIMELDLYMFEQACILLRKWIDEGRTLIPISCNFSYKDICDSTLERIRKLIDEYQVPPMFLEIEITETVAVDNLETLSAYGERINRYGLKLCVDDFGAGYSSISLLQKISIDVLKLDKELIERGTKQQFTADLLHGLVKTLQEHKIQIVCEGIETECQKNFVSDLGCEIIQGYLYSKPLPVNEFEKKYMQDQNNQNKAIKK